jgi:hypothetical protein
MAEQTTTVLNEGKASGHKPQVYIEVLARLVAEWRATRRALELPPTATVQQISDRLALSWATAQRLNRLGKLVNVNVNDLEFFPGARAWDRIMQGVENVLGAQHPNYQTLALAADHFVAWITSTGGSRSAAIREAAAAEAKIASASGELTRQNDRELCVEAWGRIFGCISDACLNVRIARHSPGLTPPRLDLATINALKTCIGKPGAMPLAFTRSTFSIEHKQFEGHDGEDARSFFLLRSMTSKPVPSILFTSDAKRQTAFVEPQWTSMTKPLDVSLMHQSAGAIPWVNNWLEFQTQNVHPCRRLILERIVSREIDAKCNASLRVYRSNEMIPHEEPWFHRIPDDTPLERFNNIEEAGANEPLSGYGALMAESLQRLKWDIEDMVVFRAVIENPIPLAHYTVMFDRI